MFRTSGSPGQGSVYLVKLLWTLRCRSFSVLSSESCSQFSLAVAQLLQVTLTVSERKLQPASPQAKQTDLFGMGTAITREMKKEKKRGVVINEQFYDSLRCFSQGERQTADI